MDRFSRVHKASATCHLKEVAYFSQRQSSTATWRKIRGIIVLSGITLIVGSGFHGKSTLLKSIQDAVYPHVTRDGRDHHSTQGSKIYTEDGRSV